MDANTTSFMLAILTLGLSAFAYKGRNILLSLGAGAMWIVLWYYVQANVNLGIMTQAFLLVAIAIGVYMIFRCIRPLRNGQGAFEDSPNIVRNITITQEHKRNPNQRETPEEYRLRARRALNSHRG